MSDTGASASDLKQFVQANFKLYNNALICD